MDADTNTDIKLRNMTSIYISCGTKILLLYRIGSRVVPPSWCGIGGHFEPDELNDPRTCVLRELEEETGLTEKDLKNISLRYVTLKLKDGEIRHCFYKQLELFLGGMPMEQEITLIMPVEAVQPDSADYDEWEHKIQEYRREFLENGDTINGSRGLHHSS